MKSFFQEFKDFAMKWSVIDLAVGIVIGTAFAAITNSLVKSIIMPLMGIVLDGIDFTELSFGLGEAQVMYGEFIQAIIEFAIIAFALFLVIKTINIAQKKTSKKEDIATKKAPTLTRDQKLLIEIRDLLEKKKK